MNLYRVFPDRLYEKELLLQFTMNVTLLSVCAEMTD